MSQNLFTYRIQTSGKQSLTNIDVYLDDALGRSELALNGELHMLLAKAPVPHLKTIRISVSRRKPMS
jgi:hypothetical protein